MLLIVGTMPDPAFEPVLGPCQAMPGGLAVAGRPVDVARGTPALMAAATAAADFLGRAAPWAWLAGDIGTGGGSRALYAAMAQGFPEPWPDVLAFHYLQPDVDWHNRVLFAAQDITPRPLLVADAGFMYAAKMSGQAEAYDLFTPDVGELAFLADEHAPHPFYTRGFILQDEERAPELAARAYAHGNAARHLLVKGVRDCLADATGILGTVELPSVAAMEAMGGTGDTVTGLAAALMEAGLSVPEACLAAARANRLAGSLAGLTPASQVASLVARIPQALKMLELDMAMKGDKA